MSVTLTGLPPLSPLVVCSSEHLTEGRNNVPVVQCANLLPHLVPVLPGVEVLEAEGEISQDLEPLLAAPQVGGLRVTHAALAADPAPSVVVLPEVGVVQDLL